MPANLNALIRYRTIVQDPESEQPEKEIRLEEKHLLSEAFQPYQEITWAWLFEIIKK